MLDDPIALHDFVARRDDKRRQVILVIGLKDGLTGVYMLPDRSRAMVDREPVQDYRRASEAEVQAAEDQGRLPARTG
jgi:hypothetical protein